MTHQQKRARLRNPPTNQSGAVGLLAPLIDVGVIARDKALSCLLPPEQRQLILAVSRITSSFHSPEDACRALHSACDAVQERQFSRAQLREYITTKLPSVHRLPLQFLHALHDSGVLGMAEATGLLCEDCLMGLCYGLRESFVLASFTGRESLWKPCTQVLLDASCFRVLDMLVGAGAASPTEWLADPCEAAVLSDLLTRARSTSCV
eukprot:TRINITY_DN35797_c0_g2_i1.p1 TRINITY_DN35797_c0_g2~~TRINITY_DN35797_c0_g2_i1.p1  ORF type:complete len:207 (+),score=29.18 TRINITY_DN35797_c0_g2_i1:24-644(+)